MKGYKVQYEICAMFHVTEMGSFQISWTKRKNDEQIIRISLWR